MLRKAVIIQSIFFMAAAVLVISATSLIGFIGYQGFQAFHYLSPIEFFTATTWNQYANRYEVSANDTSEPTLSPNPDQPLGEGQLIEPSASSEGAPIDEGSQLIEPSEPIAGEESNQGAQLIEPSEPVEGEPIDDGAQLIEPSESIDEGPSGDAQLSVSEPSDNESPLNNGLGENTASASGEDEQVGVFGVLPLLIGSLLTTLVTVLISAPLAIMVSIFMVEVAPEPMRRLLRTTVEIFAALPSVIFGLLGLIYVVPWVRETFHTGLGKGVLAASIVLVFMTQPTMVTIAEDALRSLPISLREAAMGMGATRWQMIWGVLLPAARSGIFTAVILGMGRAVGETMAVQMVIGNITEHIPTSLVNGATTMPAAIVTQLPEAALPAQRTALIMVAFVLLLIAFVLIAIVRMSARSTMQRG